MSGIAISIIQFLIIGIPQGFLLVGWVFVFTKVKFQIHKYILLSAVFTVATYLIRFLPIAVGVNTMLSLLALVLAFQAIYRFNLQVTIKLIVSVISGILVITVAELLNGVLLNILFGQVKAHELTNSGSQVIKSLCFVPSNVLFAMALLILYMALSKKGERKEIGNGKAGKKACE